MVKKRQLKQRAPYVLPGRHAEIEDVAFAPGRQLALDVVTLRGLFAREQPRDLTGMQRPGFHMLVLGTRGSGTYVVDFVSHPLRPGTVLHVAPGQVQRFPLETRCDATMIVFQPYFVRLAAKPGAQVRLEGARRSTVEALFEAVTAEHAVYDGTLRSRELLARLVESIVLAIDVEPELPETADLLPRFRAALEKSFPRAHEVAAYAAALRCSTRTLTRHCERWAGQSAKQLIDERVALEARRLLAHGSKSVAQLSQDLGFAEPTQFVKFFRRVIGETPGHFRERLRRGVTPGS